MPKRSNRNVYVERAVNRALARIDDLIGGAELQKLPSSAYRRACDQVLQDRSASARVAGLFLAFYQLEDADWTMQTVPRGTRGKYGDKRLSNELTLRNLTLHSNITAFGENLGWKGDVGKVDLTIESHFSNWTAATLGASIEEQVYMADYFASRFAQSRVVIEPLPPVGADVLTFPRARQLIYAVLEIPSNGYIPQFMIAALLYEFRQNQGIEVLTHHPNAADRFDKTAGDIEERVEGQLIRAYEVTMRADWQSRISDFKSKMDAASLDKYTIIASGVNRDMTWAIPAHMALALSQYERDIAIIDIKDVVNFLSAELTAVELRNAVNRTFNYLNNPRLCGKLEYIEAYCIAVDRWLDSVDR